MKTNIHMIPYLYGSNNCIRLVLFGWENTAVEENVVGKLGGGIGSLQVSSHFLKAQVIFSLGHWHLLCSTGGTKPISRGTPTMKAICMHFIYGH